MGLFDSLTGGGGLLGLGGSQGMMNPAYGLLGSNIDQQAMRNYTLKNMLLGTGIAMLGQQPTVAPQSFGSNLGQGLAAGMTQGQAAQKGYMQTVMYANQLKQQQQQMQIAQDAANHSNALFPGQLAAQGAQSKLTDLQLAEAKAKQDALNGAPPAAYLNPGAWGATQIPQLTDLPYGQGKMWTTYDPSKLNQPIGGSGGQMDINNIPPATIDPRGYVDPISQQANYAAMGGDKNPLAAAALQIATNQRSLSPREVQNLPLQQMVHLLNPSWQNSDYNTVQSINKDFASGKASVKMVSAEQGTGHLDDAWRKTYVLPDVGIAKANEWGNYIRSGFNAPDISAVDPALKIAGNESVKLALGEGGAESDRKLAYDNFNAMGTAQGREAAFKTVVDQGNQSVLSLFDQYRNAHNGSLRGFNPNVIAKRIAITRELGNDTSALDNAFKETTGQSYQDALPSLMKNGTLNKLDTIDWSTIQDPKFRDLKKQAYAQINAGDPNAGFETLVKGGAKLIGSAPDTSQAPAAGSLTGKTSTGVGWSFQ